MSLVLKSSHSSTARSQAATGDKDGYLRNHSTVTRNLFLLVNGGSLRPQHPRLTTTHLERWTVLLLSWWISDAKHSDFLKHLKL